MLQVHSPRVKDLPWVSHGFQFFFAIFFLPNGSCFQRFILRSGLISLSCAKRCDKKTSHSIVVRQACEAHNLLTKSEIPSQAVFLCGSFFCLPLCTPNLYVESRSRNRTETATKLDGPDVGSSIFGSNQNPRCKESMTT